LPSFVDLGQGFDSDNTSWQEICYGNTLSLGVAIV
jgi:hypothetical protein